MTLLQLDMYTKNTRTVAVVAIAICAIAWILEFTAYVYVCPYCRVQRTVIGVLGLILLLPIASHWVSKYAALVIGFFGAVVGANQHFSGWRKISSGEFEFAKNIVIDPFLLSGAAITIIIGLVALILFKSATPPDHLAD